MKSLFLLCITFLTINVCLADKTEYFPADYEKSRERFLTYGKKIERAYQKVSLTKIIVGQEKLTVDTIYIPAQKIEKKLIIISSGNHGAEGYTGSALQTLFMEEVLSTLDLSETGILLIHALNPWGFKYHRRGTEHNVNLNRNFDISENLFKLKNEGYTQVRNFLAVTKKVMSEWEFPTKDLLLEILLSKKVTQQSLVEAISKGQYEYPRGLNFGGAGFESQTLEIISLLSEIAKPYGAIFSIDIHTGLGERGVLHLMPEDPTNQVSKEFYGKVFNHPEDKEKYDLTPTTREGFYEVSGDYTSILPKIFPQADRIILSATAEFGTIGGGLYGKILTINRLILENQGYFYGYANEKVETEIKKDYMELFYPESSMWKNQVLDRGRYLVDTVVKRFISTN